MGRFKTFDESIPGDKVTPLDGGNGDQGVVTQDYQVCQPDIDQISDGLAITWPSGDESRVIIGLHRITEDTRTAGIWAEVEIAIDPDGSGPTRLLANSRVNLVSPRSRNELVKLIKERSFTDNIQYYPWVTLVEQVAGVAIAHSRRGESAVSVGKKPKTMKVEYQLAPILEKNQPTTIYGPGGSAKSYLGDYIAVLTQFNIAGITEPNSCWMPAAGNVLYLDWEASKEDHDRRVWAIKKGLGIDSEETFLYRFCSQPLINDIHSIQTLVFENKIDLTIVDSQMAASGYGPDQAQVASQFYNALRSLRCTTLTLDHVNKEDWKGTDSVGPYGSVVKYNRSRSQFEIRKSQNAGEDFIELSLIHRKHNEGRLLKPIGIRIHFAENSERELESVTFQSCNVTDNPELSKTLSTSRVVKKGFDERFWCGGSRWRLSRAGLGRVLVPPERGFLSPLGVSDGTLRPGG